MATVRAQYAHDMIEISIYFSDDDSCLKTVISDGSSEACQIASANYDVWSTGDVFEAHTDHGRDEVEDNGKVRPAKDDH